MFGQNDAAEQIKNLGRLEAGWDSYEAAPISDAAMRSALHCLHEARGFFGGGYAEPIVGPTPDGGVALIWRKPGREEVNAIFSTQGAKYIIIGIDRRVTAQGPISDPGAFSRDVLKPRLK
jgi:hypothetical protein